MRQIRRRATHGAKPMKRWSQRFDELEKKFKMGDHALSAIDDIKTGRNCGEPNGVANNHILPRTFVKNYYRPLTQVSRCPAQHLKRWTKIPIGAVASRKNFYTIIASDGTDNTTLEQFFGRIETHVPSWLKDNGLHPYNRGETEYWLAWFIATQLLRTPLAAKAQKQLHNVNPPNMPIGVHIAANLYQAQKTAKLIFSWHWTMWKLDSHQSEEETLLGESCVYRYHGGVIFNIQKNTALTCSPRINTPCETLECKSKKQELIMVRELNKLTVKTNKANGGYLYRSTPPK